MEPSETVTQSLFFLCRNTTVQNQSVKMGVDVLYFYTFLDYMNLINYHKCFSFQLVEEKTMVFKT